jgi:hypothetical protein
LLGALYEIDDEDQRTGLWYGAWATLCPGDQVYSAAYAAVPHVLRIAADRDFIERVSAIHLVTQAEVLRHGAGAPPIDDDLLRAYASAIESLPARVEELLGMTWDEPTARVLAAGLLAGKRQHALARELIQPGPIETGS